MESMSASSSAIHDVRMQFQATIATLMAEKEQLFAELEEARAARYCAQRRKGETQRNSTCTDASKHCTLVHAGTKLKSVNEKQSVL